MTEENEKRILNLEAINTVQAHKINILTSRLALVEIGLQAVMKEFKMKIVTSEDK